MDVIICDISAWEYWRTPSQLSSVEISLEELGAILDERAPLIRALRKPRANMREVARLVAERLCGQLKGLSTPVHVMVDETAAGRSSSLVHVHRLPRHLPSGGVVSLGGGLSVLSPELTLAIHCQQRTVSQIAKMMYEACGIFSLCPSNERIEYLVRRLVQDGVLYRGCVPSNQEIYGCYNSSGVMQGFLDYEGEPLPWSPSFDRRDSITDIWRRPPLTTMERVRDVLSQLSGMRGLEEARRAAKIARDGAASPEEVKAHMLLCSGTWAGGESWGDPMLNMRVELTPEARALAHRQFCIADFLWKDRLGDLEVNGEAFHADARGFAVESGRRAALESMGYHVVDINHEQMANLELFDAMLPAMARALGFPLQERTPAFLKRRDELHRELFDRPFEPVWEERPRKRRRAKK